MPWNEYLGILSRIKMKLAKLLFRIRSLQATKHSTTFEQIVKNCNEMKTNHMSNNNIS